MTAPSTRPEPLPSKPGGETNLLHRTAWADPSNPLRVEFKPWYESPPPTPGTERVDVFLGNNEGNVIASWTWNLPMLPADHYIEITSDKLPQGEQQISFIMTNYLGVSARSFPYTVTVDKQEPVLNASSRLTFPAAVLPPNKLTARYLEQNGDEVKAGLPAYTTPRPWDIITWYWGSTAGNLEQGGVIELDDKNYSAPVTITVPGDLIRSRGDGPRYVWYQVHDRAGNASLRSEPPVELEVAATPIPRVLPHVKIQEVPGTQPSGILNPLNAINGVTVTISKDAVIYDDEGVYVQWAQEDSPGSCRTNTPITPGSRDYKIPSDKVRYHIGRTLVVGYEVIEPGVDEPHRSNPFNLQVERLTGTPVIQCNKVSGGQLSLASVPAGGYADFTLERWSHMGTEQLLTITVIGLGTDNKALTIPVLNESPVPEVAQKINVGWISKADLLRFKPNNQLEVRVRVSFDGKLTWQSFGSLRPMLVA
jgi:hypothetical protein